MIKHDAAKKQSRQIDHSGDHASLPFGTTLSHYRIVSLLGCGGMGDVYKAFDKSLNRFVALKVLPADLVSNRERLQRFAQEARSASALSHPNIVTIFEIGQGRIELNRDSAGIESSLLERDIDFIAMEYIEGESLRSRIAARLSLEPALDLLTQVALGLAKAHAEGIIHRDLKPENIMVADDEYVKIIDFGLAKLIENNGPLSGDRSDSPTAPAITHEGDIIGTAGYMSPEQVQGRPVDPRSDIFSFGCILYEAVTGAKPFAAGSLIDTLYEIVHKDPTPLAELNAALPDELQRIVRKCLEKNPEDRYQSIKEVAVDLRQLRRFVAGVSPSPGRMFEGVTVSGTRLQQKKERRGMLLTAAIAALIAVAAIVLALIQGPDLGGTTQKVTGAFEPQEARRLTNSGKVMSAVLSPDGKYAAYIMHDGARQSLSVEQLATGTKLQIIPPAEVKYAGLTFAIDSNYLYFVRYHKSFYGGLFQIPILGGTPAEIINDVDTAVSFSPDGKKFAFRRDDWNSDESLLMVANADGTQERRVASFPLPHRISRPAWSPDGRSILVAQRANLFQIVVQSGAKNLLPVPDTFAFIQDVNWTSDGTGIVASARDHSAGPNFQLWHVSIGSKEARRVTNDVNDYYGVSLAADGRAAVSVQSIKRANLWVAGSDASDWRQLTTGFATGDGLGGTAWTPDGRIVYSSHSAGSYDIWIMNADGSGATQLTRESTGELQPAIARDGSFISYVAITKKGMQLWRMNVDGTGRKLLVDGIEAQTFAISPDSKFIYFAHRETKDSPVGLWRANADGSNPVKLAATGSALSAIQVTPDGKWLVYSAYRDSKTLVWKLAAGGGTPLPLTTEAASAPMISPDGTMIAAMYKQEGLTSSKLAILPIGGGAPLKIFDTDGMRYRWTRDGKAVDFIRRTEGSAEVWRQVLDEDEPRPLTKFQQDYLADFQFTPDGSKLLCVRVATADDAVLLKSK